MVKFMKFPFIKLLLFILIILPNSNEAFHSNFLHGTSIRHIYSRNPRSGLVRFKIYTPSRVLTHLRRNSLISLSETGRNSGGISDQVYKEFDQAVEINDLLLVEDLIMVLILFSTPHFYETPAGTQYFDCYY